MNVEFVEDTRQAFLGSARKGTNVVVNGTAMGLLVAPQPGAMVNFYPNEQCVLAAGDVLAIANHMLAVNRAGLPFTRPISGWRDYKMESEPQ